MINSAYRKLTSAILILCLVYGQGFGQVATEIMNYNRQQYTAVQDNTRIVKPLMSAKMASDMQFSMDLKFAADRIIKLYSKGLTTKEQREEFNKTANNYIVSFYNVAAGKAKTSPELHSTVYNAVLPIIWFNAELTNKDFYYKISTLYRTQYNSCVGQLDKCDADKTGSALLFLNSYNPDLVKLSKISSAMTDENTGEEAKINFMQYAAPVLADRGGKVYFEEIINKLSTQAKPITKVTSGYVDPFAFIKAFDNSYQWIKETCTHKDGFGGGVCAAFKSGKNPFRQYKTPKTPATVKGIYAEQMKNNKDTGKILLYISSSAKQPAQLSAAVRMYGEFYSGQYDWRDAFKFLLTAHLPSDAMVTCHRDIALSQLALKSDLPAAEKTSVRFYMAARINNDYFALNNNTDIDQALRASLKNELGKTYAALIGYKGASPVKVISDEGFYSDIAFKDNEQEIEGFWKSMFNFQDRPAEAVTNVFILGIITKGAIKNSDKIWAGIVNLFKGSTKLVVNMPSIVKRAQVQYKALKYLAGKNSMGTANYVYKNAVYRAASKTAVKGGLNTVEGVAAKEFFASSHYTASAHGNIGRVSKDINKAVSAGLTDLSKGGAIPSYVSEAQYKNGFNAYSQDLLTQQQKLLQTKVASKYKVKKLPVKASASQKTAQATAQSAADAPYLLPRKYMYSADKSRSLQFAQNEAFAQEYTFKNAVYGGLKQRGFDFVHTGTGLSLGENLIFHNMGFLQASGKVGLTYSASANGAGGFTGAAQSVLGSAANNIMAPVETLKLLAKNTIGLKQAVNILNLGRRAAAFNNALMSPQKAFETYYKISLMSLQGGKLLPHIPGKIITDFTTPAQQEMASFKVSRSEGDKGSGFLLNYRGMPVVITAGHVVQDNKFVYVEDSRGQKETGVVLKSVFSPNMDLAAIFLKPAFLEGRIPFELSLREPKVTDPVIALGFPGGREYSRSVLTIFENDYKLRGIKAPFYMTTTDNLTYGNSGGPLLFGDLKERVAGVAYSLTEDESNVLFTSLKTLKKFMSALARDIIVDPLYREEWLPLFPEFAKNYSNAIASKKSFDKLALPEPIKFEQEPDILPDINFLSTHNRNAVMEKVEQATFKIKRRSDNVGGSGFYIKYRGLPMIVTAAHVVRDDVRVEILDSEGILSFGDVFDRSMISRGYDFALILPEKGFLDNKVPLNLSFKEPLVKEGLLAAGFPKDTWLKRIEVTLDDAKFMFQDGIKPVYKVVPETGYGTSGGPLVRFDGKGGSVVGVAHMGGGGEGFFTTLPQLRDFLTSTFKSKFADPKFQLNAFLKEYPELAKNYSNLLSYYKESAGKGFFSYTQKLPVLPSNHPIHLAATDYSAPSLSASNKLRFEDASFIVTSNDGQYFGSGFYIKHRGVPMVITTGHLVGADKTVTLTDKEGQTADAKVLATSGTKRGRDIALLLTDPSFLIARKPLVLSAKEQPAGSSLFGFGFNIMGDILSKSFNLISPSFSLEGGFKSVYKASPALDPGFSGGPLSSLEAEGTVSGFAHMTNAQNSFFIPSSTIRSFIKQAFITELSNPAAGSLAQTYPAFAQTYANILESGLLKRKDSFFSIGEGAKRFGFKLMTGVFNMPPKQALNKLYSWGAKPSAWKGYPSLSLHTYKIDNIADYAADLSKPLPEYPFNSSKAYYYRGMALDIPALQNINANGIRLQDVGSHNNDFLVLSYPSAGLAKYAKGLDCNKTICLTGDPKDAAHYALKHTGAEKQIPVVVHIKDIQVGGDAALGSSILMTAVSDIPSDKISVYSGLMNVNGNNLWGKLGFASDGTLTFTPYVKSVPIHPLPGPVVRKPSVVQPQMKQLKTLPEFYYNFKSVFTKPLFAPVLAEKFKLPGIKNLINGRGLLGEKFTSFNIEAYKKYYNGVKSAVIEIENPLLGKTGSGFYLKKGNVEALVTAGHLLDGSSTVRIRPAIADGQGDWYTANVAGYSLGAATDIGLIEINNNEFWNQMKPLGIASSYPKEGENIFSYGFPWGITFEERVGIFQGFETVGEKRLIRASEHTAPGNSGGPILYQGQVIGICKKGINSEELARNPDNMKSSKPLSWHTTWEEIESFLYKAALKTYPQDLGWRQDPSFKSSFLKLAIAAQEPGRLLLNPRHYGFKDIILGEPKPISDDDYYMDFAFTKTIKKLGVSALGITVKMPPREALLKMYGYGFKPSSTPMPRTYGEGFEIDDITLYKPDMTKRLPQYPFNENKKYVFRGMSLNTESVINIHDNGLRLQDVGESNSLYLHAIAPGAMRGVGMSDFRTLCFTETPSEAAFYSMRGLTGEKPIPTVTNVKGIKESNTRGFGILINRDIPNDQIVSVNSLLNINGENVWGRLIREDGKLIFYPYKK